MSLITDVLGGLYELGKTTVKDISSGIDKVWKTGTDLFDFDSNITSDATKNVTDKVINTSPNSLKNAGSIVGALGDIYSVYNTSKFNDKMYNLEKTRIDDLYEKEEKQQKAVETGFANSEYGKGNY